VYTELELESESDNSITCARSLCLEIEQRDNYISFIRLLFVLFIRSLDNWSKAFNQGNGKSLMKKRNYKKAGPELTGHTFGEGVGHGDWWR
jgi:hypothetical protein